MLTFRESDHTYWIENKQIPSVSSILACAGVSESHKIDPAKLKRGADVHAAIAEVLDAKELFEHAESPFVEQAIKFIRDTKAEVIACEKMIFHADLWYAGRVDLVCRIDDETHLIDWKLNTIYKSTGAQMSAYAAAWNHQCTKSRNMIQRIGAVRLCKDKYQWVDSRSPLWPSDGTRDFATFLGALKAHGKKETEQTEENGNTVRGVA